MYKLHTFHIPVMGTGFSIDTPIKVAKYGIASVISLVDDFLIEEMRRIYAKAYNEAYTPISREEPDYRAKRITAYLELVDRIVQKEFEKLRNAPFSPGSEITKYFEMLPDASPLKGLYRTMLKTTDPEIRHELEGNLRELIEPGDINVNIMTKLDRPFYGGDGKPLSAEFSEAMAALRGMAKSRTKTAIEFSAGLNQRLYTYAAEFKDFYADVAGNIAKKIILKVSDYRSALVQGKIFAKKGLWVSEFRIESGLNCGGHAFATPGVLMGPILEEFRAKRQELAATLHTIYNEAAKIKNKIPFAKPQPIKITVQGGIGTVEEDKFLRQYYGLDSTGWGTPFLLCPEVSNVDAVTLERLRAAQEADLYLSDVSPLGVPFNNLKGSLSDDEKDRRAREGNPGSFCPLGHLTFNTEFTSRPICVASRAYQKLKIKQLEEKKLPAEEHKRELDKITVKACICHDLGESVYINYNQGDTTKRFPAVCPGPNLAYFDKVASLKDMVDHIYGRANLLAKKYRPHVFVKELQVYVDYLGKEITKTLPQLEDRDRQYFTEYKDNLLKGIEYYQDLFSKKVELLQETRQKILAELQSARRQLDELTAQYPAVFNAAG